MATHWPDFFIYTSLLFLVCHDYNKMFNYTLSIKRNFTSLKRRSLKSIASKLIIFRHRYAIVLLMKHIWKSKGCFYQKRRQIWWNRKRSVSKITQTAHWEPPQKAAYSEHLIAFHSISKASYCDCRTCFCPCPASWPGGEIFFPKQVYLLLRESDLHQDHRYQT